MKSKPTSSVARLPMVPPIKEEEPVANLDDIDVKKPDDAALAEEL